MITNEGLADVELEEAMEVQRVRLLTGTDAVIDPGTADLISIEDDPASDGFVVVGRITLTKQRTISRGTLTESVVPESLMDVEVSQCLDALSDSLILLASDLKRQARQVRKRGLTS